jgi:hypothetical protein
LHEAAKSNAEHQYPPSIDVRFFFPLRHSSDRPGFWLAELLDARVAAVSGAVLGSAFLATSESPEKDGRDVLFADTASARGLGVGAVSGRAVGCGAVAGVGFGMVLVASVSRPSTMPVRLGGGGWSARRENHAVCAGAAVVSGRGVGVGGAPVMLCVVRPPAAALETRVAAVSGAAAVSGRGVRVGAFAGVRPAVLRGALPSSRSFVL